jgi:hypothetical protein
MIVRGFFVPYTVGGATPVAIVEFHAFTLANECPDTVLCVRDDSVCRGTWHRPSRRVKEKREEESANFRKYFSSNYLNTYKHLRAIFLSLASTAMTKKILILGRHKSGKLSLVKSLTSSLPVGLIDQETPHAGLTHFVHLSTRYYSTEAGIWIDELPEDSSVWLEEYLSEEAIPVLQSLAAVLLTVDPSSCTLEDDLRVLKRLNERGEEVEWDGISLVVGRQFKESTTSGLENLCDEYAFEYIDLNMSGNNEFGGMLDVERELT